MSLISKAIGKYKSIPVPAKASLWYTVCNILQKGISFIIIPVYVRILTTAEYGSYSVFQSWRDILIIFATLNLYCGVFTKAMVDYDKDRDRYTASMQGLTTLTTSALFFVYIVARDFWNGVLEMGTVTMLLLFAYFILYPAFTFWCVRQRVEYKYVKMIIITLAASVAAPVISILLLMFTELRAEAVIWGYLISQCSVGLFFYIYHFIKSQAFYVKDYWKKALKFNLPLVPHYLSIIVLGQSDRIMIKEYCGEAQAGIYNLAYQVSMIMSIFVNAINNSLVPWTYEQFKVKSYKKVTDVTTKLCALMMVMTLGVMIVAPEIVAILGTDEYYAAVWVIPAVAASVYFTFCYGLFNTVEFYLNYTSVIMIASVIGAVLNVVLNAIFIPMYGFIAAGYTTAVCYFVFMVMHYLFIRKVSKQEFKGQSVYNIGFMGLTLIIVCACGAGFMLLYNFRLVRCLIVVAALVVLFLIRKRIIGIFKEMK